MKQFKKTKIIIILFSLAIMFGIYKLYNYSVQTPKKIKENHSKLDIYKSDKLDSIYNLTKVDDIRPFLYSRKLPEITAAISVLRNMDKDFEKKKVVVVLEELWINGFVQYVGTEKNSVFIPLKIVKLDLAAALYVQTNRIEFLEYIKNKKENGLPSEKSNATILLDDLQNIYQQTKNEPNLYNINLPIKHIDDGQDAIDLKKIKEKYYKENDYYARMNMIYDLGKEKSPQAQELLLDIWNSIDESTTDKDDFNLKMNAAVSLWETGKIQYIDFVYEQLKSSFMERRTQAAQLLGMVNTEQSRKGLIHLVMNDNRLPPAYAAATSLAKIGTVAIIPDLDKANERKLGNLNDAIKNAIDEILSRYNKYNKESP